jgi:cytoskeletal protein RodZ
MSDRGRSLGLQLRAAREAKGWDLARAERETRIRARYLAALEQGDYRDLPSPVYTRGFVRNYAQYVGLDPERAIDAYRREAFPEDPARKPVVQPQPIAARRGGTLILTRGRVAAVALLALVLALVGYMAYQFITFAGTPALTITAPATDVAAYPATVYVIRGETEPNAEITVDGLRTTPAVTASASGSFSVRVELVPGSNVITLVATDPVTGRTSDPVQRTITVTLAVETPAPSGSPAAPSTPPASP